MNKNDNKRREPRLPASVAVDVIRGRDATSHETQDVSYRGIFLRGVVAIPLRSLVRLKLTLPVRRIDAHAMVVHTSDAAGGHGLGLQFFGLAGPDQRAWDEFVRGLAQTRRAAAKANDLESAAMESGIVAPGIDDVHPASLEAPSGVRPAPATSTVVACVEPSEPSLASPQRTRR